MFQGRFEKVGFAKQGFDDDDQPGFFYDTKHHRLERANGEVFHAGVEHYC